MRLLLAITGHGFGHLAQCAPVVAALREAGPLELVVRSNLPSEILTARLGPLVELLPSDAEFGAVMHGGVAIDRGATLARYRTLHARLPGEIAGLVDAMQATRCDGVLSNVSYIAAAAAAQAGLPSVVFSSLTWHDIAAVYFADAPDLSQEILACYRQATRVLCLRPGTQFRGLSATAVSQPIARVGRRRRAELVARLGIDPGRPIALLAFGGMLPRATPPLVAEPGDFALLGPAAWAGRDLTAIDAIDLPFEDLLASVDIVVSKPGYGIVTELGSLGTPSVLVDRPDWPERSSQLHWLQARGQCLVVPHIDAVNERALRDCLALVAPGMARAEPGGEVVVAEAVLTSLGVAR